jgi:hypothetical protein
MADIDYCDIPPEHDWSNPLLGDFCDQTAQDAIDGWLALQEKEWFPDDKKRSKDRRQSLEERFVEYANRWERETAFISATPMRVMHESYQSIMSMGPDVVPILLRDLQKTQRHWFWALRHLTSADPVPEKDRGNVDRMAAAWIAWGKAKGKI